MQVDMKVTPEALQHQVQTFFELSGPKIAKLAKRWNPSHGSPVFTVNGEYTTRGWTEWTQGFQYGCQILQFDGTEDASFWEMGRASTMQYMAPHITHIGVHDHGFNQVSTYGNLRRLAREGRTLETGDAMRLYGLALRASGAVQAMRWTKTADGGGYIYSFNGAHSLFSDTLRSVRALVVAHQLGHVLMGEGDEKISLLGRALQHIEITLRYNVYHGKGRDLYDVPGRVVHESLFNPANGVYRCPSTQQGYSPFSTWTRGLAWILLGCAEELEAIASMPDKVLEPYGGKSKWVTMLQHAASATADFFIEHTARDGIPYWDTGAPGLAAMKNWKDKPSEPDNAYEPVDSSAAAISAQGLLRLGTYLGVNKGGKRYFQAGLTTARTLLQKPYLSEDPKHEGLILHSIYHRPNDWDHIPRGKKVPQGESSMWGDYHAMELAVLIQRLAETSRPYLVFFD